MTDLIAYKILAADQLAMLEAEGAFVGAPIDVEDGYIHLSTAAQVAETIAKHFAGQDAVQIAAIDLEALGDAIRWEPSRGGQLFPHLYGEPITLEVVIAYGPVEYEPDGTLKLPTAG